MARILFGVPPAVGHINPTIPIALKLRERGNDVAFICHSAFADRIRRFGLDILEGVGWGGQFARAEEIVGRASGLRALRHARTLLPSRILSERLPEASAELLQLLREWQADVVVADYMFTPGHIAADAAGIPYATSFPGIPVLSADGLPPYRSGLPPDARPSLRWSVMRAANRLLIGRIADPINRTRRRFGLSPVRDGIFEPSPWLYLVYMTEALEYSQRRIPLQVHYVGPSICPAPAQEPEDFPWERLDGRPLVYLSLGSTHTAHAAFFDRAIEASRSENWQMVIATGLYQDPASWVDAAENVIVRRWAPQGEILRRAQALVTHGGLNTVVEALALGVPMAVATANRSQPEVAQRVVSAGAGIRLSLKRAKVEELKGAIRRLLADSNYREGARRVAADFARCDGPGTAARLIEELAESRRPVFRPEGSRATVYAGKMESSSPAAQEGG